VRDIPLSKLVRDDMLALILKGVLVPGQRINEPDVASRLQVSRVPVREALRELESSGLVISRKHSGVFVRQLDAAEVRDLYQMRGLLDGFAGRCAARLPDAQREALLTVLEASGQRHAAGRRAARRAALLLGKPALSLGHRRGRGDKTMKRRTLLQAAPALIYAPGLALAQPAYPTKPIRYIVPVAAGGGSDLVGRTVTERWGKALNQSFVVDNQGGGGGVIACQTTARAAPDGYTLMQGYVATHGTSPATRKVPYDADQGLHAHRHDRRHAQRAGGQRQRAGQERQGIHRVPEEEPGKVSYGSAGPAR
jgi:DNA-binding transcriptional regulator YhcF (GntR family)